MPEPPHKRLEQAMKERRLDLGMNWRELAARAGISYEALRSIRRGDYRPSDITARGLDDALGWARGTTLAYLDDADLPPAQTPGEQYLDEFKDDPEFVELLNQLPPRARRRALEQWAAERQRARAAYKEMLRLAADAHSGEDERRAQ